MNISSSGGHEFGCLDFAGSSQFSGAGLEVFDPAVGDGVLDDELPMT